VKHFTGINALPQKAQAPLAGIAIGMAGALVESDRQRIRAAAAKVWPNVPVTRPTIWKRRWRRTINAATPRRPRMS
jgi:hypothetical protein